MAAPSSTSSSSMDPVTVPLPTSSSSSNPLRLYPSSSISPPPLPLPIATPLFPAQPILGKPPNPPPPQGIIYPVAPPSRGFPPRTSVRNPSPDQMVTVANPAGYIRNNSPTAVLTFPAAQARPFVFSSDHTAQSQQPPVHSMRPPLQAQPAPFVVPRQVGSGGGSGHHPKSAPAVIQTKVTLFPTVASAGEHNNYKDLRDKSRDDTVVMIKDRKVRLLDGGSGSLYALCRSWVWNGTPQESQPNHGDGVKLLPTPLPATVTGTTKSRKNEGNEEDEDPEKEEHVGDLQHLSTRDLLDRHIKRAKRVRARLKGERLQRIERYKQRLSLLLPMPVEQFRNHIFNGLHE